MPRKTKLIIELTEEERSELEAWQRSTTIRAGLAKRGRVVLLCADQTPLARIAVLVGMRRQHVEKWVRRFLHGRIGSLNDRPGRGRKPAFSPGGRDTRGEDRVRAA